MNTMTDLRRTPLYQAQKQLGARFVDFHGWDLPIQFSGILKEHTAVRTLCGLFDVSHMGQVEVEGPKALDFLQWVNSNDIRRAVPGKGVYSHLLNERGGIVDDVIAFCLAPESYWVVVNAATQDKDFAFFQEHAERFGVRLANRSADIAMLALQGPKAAVLMGDFAPEAAALKRFGILRKEIYGQPCLISRTGYTGEDGFEVQCPNEIAPRVWENLLVKGRPHGLQPCGLGSRDTLRLEAGYLLYGQDADDDHTSLEAAYDWVLRFDKGDFNGKAALEAQKKAGLKRRLAAVKLLEGGVPRSGSAFFSGNRRAGVFTSATYSPTLKAGIGVGYAEPPLKAGEAVEVELHGRRVKAEVVELPFYAPAP